jgi:arylsulfatase A-like enzyme
MFQRVSRKYFRSYVSDASTRDLTRLAIAWLKSNRDEDFFLWLHYYDPHVPYGPPRKFLPKGEPPPRIGKFFAKHNEVRDKKFIPSPAEKEWIKKLYEGEVRYVDDSIGYFLDALKRLNIYDESLIVFGSDHGEEFWEHNGYEHGHALYNEVLQVPLIIKLPGSASNGRVDTWVSTERITPTILDIIGIQYDRNYLSDGSLSPLWSENKVQLNGQSIISKGTLYFQEQESVIFGDMKYIRFLGSGREELYNLANDSAEKTSLFGSSTQMLQQARNLLKKHKMAAGLLVQLYKIGEVEKAEIDKATTEKLKSLGYIQ